MKEFTCNSHFTIKFEYFDNHKDNLVVLLHGYNQSPEDLIPYVNLFKNSNVIIYQGIFPVKTLYQLEGDFNKRCWYFSNPKEQIFDIDHMFAASVINDHLKTFNNQKVTLIGHSQG